MLTVLFLINLHQLELFLKDGRFNCCKGSF